MEVYVVTLIVILVFVGVYYYRKRDTDNVKYEMLDKEEKQVVDLLQDKEDVEQKKISEQLEWNDAKTSRVTSSLINKNIVDKYRESRTNRVELQENMENKEKIKNS